MTLPDRMWCRIWFPGSVGLFLAPFKKEFPRSSPRHAWRLRRSRDQHHGAEADISYGRALVKVLRLARLLFRLLSRQMVRIWRGFWCSETVCLSNSKMTTAKHLCFSRSKAGSQKGFPNRPPAIWRRPLESADYLGLARPFNHCHRRFALLPFETER